MLYGVGGYGDHPYGVDDFTSAAVADDRSLLLADEEAARVHLVTALPVTQAGAPAYGSPDYATQWADAESHLEEPFPWRVESALDFESTIFGGNLSFVGLSRPSVGAIRVTRDPQDAAPIWDWDWDGRPLTVRLGRPGTNLGTSGWTLSQYFTVLSGRIRDILIEDGSFRLLVLDAGLELREPLQTATYAGTGDGATGAARLEGGEDLKDARKPFLFGDGRNIRPRVVDRGFNVYQVHDRRIAGVSAVYDGGYPFPEAFPGANDISDQAFSSVYDWDGVPSGTYITDLANGLIRTSTTAAKALTCDATGDADASLGGYVETTADCIERVLRQRAAYVDADFNANAFAQLNISTPGSKGYYSETGDGTVEQVVGAFLLPFCFLQFDREERARVGSLAFQPQSLVLDGAKVIDVKTIETPPARYRVRLGHSKSWTVQRDDDLNDAASEEQRAFVGEEYRVATSEDATVETQRANSEELRLDTLYTNASDAENEAARGLSLLSTRARSYQARCRAIQLQAVEGRTVRLYWDDFGLESGRDMIVLGVRENSSTRETLLTLWG